LRALGATLAMGNPITSISNRSRQGVFSHRCLRKASAADPVITGLGGSAGIAGGTGNTDAAEGIGGVGCGTLVQKFAGKTRHFRR
jgi:hypothetical protein